MNKLGKVYERWRFQKLESSQVGSSPKHHSSQSQSKLFELEVSQLTAAITQGDIELPASTRPVLARLPDVGIGIAGGIVAEAAAACRYGLLDVV